MNQLTSTKRTKHRYAVDVIERTVCRIKDLKNFEIYAFSSENIDYNEKERKINEILILLYLVGSVVLPYPFICCLRRSLTLELVKLIFLSLEFSPL